MMTKIVGLSFVVLGEAGWGVLRRRWMITENSDTSPHMLGRDANGNTRTHCQDECVRLYPADCGYISYDDNMKSKQGGSSSGRNCEMYNHSLVDLMTYNESMGEMWFDESTSSHVNYVEDYWSGVWDYTAPPTVSPTASPTAGALEDPHITNLHGQHFQLHRSGRFNMLEVKSQSNQEVTLRVHADMASLAAKACAATYIRRVGIYDGVSEVSVSRGSSANFQEVDSESFQICDSESKCISHDQFASNNMSTFQIAATGNVECSHESKSDCQAFVISNSFSTLKVGAGASASKRRHFLDLTIQNFNVPDAHLVTGLLWNDNVPNDAC